MLDEEFSRFVHIVVIEILVNRVGNVLRRDGVEEAAQHVAEKLVVDASLVHNVEVLHGKSSETKPCIMITFMGSER